jgi:phosphoribosylaminoimidazole-succinocarboxamide synthase
MKVGKIIAQGKTKIVYAGPQNDQVAIENRDIITAGDGAKHDVVKGKGFYVNETTHDCFLLLRKNGIRNHYVRRVDERTFIAWRLNMIFLEIVIRRVAKGSYLARHPNTPEGTIFDPPKVGLHFKDNEHNDPFALWIEEKGVFELYKPRQPLAPDTYIRDLKPSELFMPDGHVFGQAEVDQLYNLGTEVFLILENAFGKLDCDLHDLKIECGWDPSGRIAVGDDFGPDCWRLEERSRGGQTLDKDEYRQQKISDSELLGRMGSKYARAAELTKKFL